MKRLAPSLAITLLLYGGTAYAQEAIVEGRGVPVGEGAVVHTNAGVEAGVDSNVFYADDATGVGPVAAPIMRAMASAAIASEHNKPDKDKSSVLSVEDANTTITGDPIELDKPKPDWDFRFALRLAYNQYIGVGHESLTQDINESISQQSNLSGGLDAHVESNPEGQWSFFVDNNLVRDNRPRNFVSTGILRRWNNDFQVGGRWRPGNGALDFSVRYENLIDRFDDTQVPAPAPPTNAQIANRMNHNLRAKAEWQFLPITRFFFDGSFGIFGPLGDNGIKPSSLPLRLAVGTSTLITENTSVRAHVGFGKGFYATGPDFTMALFGAEFGWRYSPVGRITIAYQYDFRDSINANFYRDHAVVAKVDHQMQQILLDFGVQARLRGYRGILGAPLGSVFENRDDLIIVTRAKAHYLTRDWLAFNAIFDLVVDSTGYTDMMGDNPSFTRAEFVLGAVAAF